MNYIFPLKSEKSGIKTFIKCIFYLWNEIAIPLFDVTLQPDSYSYSSTPLIRAQDCGIVVLDNKNKARWVHVAQYFSQKKQNQNALKHFKTAENFAERSKTNVFIWEKISRVFFCPASSAILDCSKCHASRAESAIYTSYIYGYNDENMNI